MPHRGVLPNNRLQPSAPRAIMSATAEAAFWPDKPMNDVRLPMLFVPTALLATALAAAQQLDIPRPVSSMLRAKYPGWQLSPLYPDVVEAVRAQQRRGPLNLIRGDFDGNGEIDLAMLIEYGRKRQTETGVVEVVVVLRKNSRHEMSVLEGPDAHIGKKYIRLIRRGSPGYDLDTNTNFVYKQDSIGVEFAGTGGHAWVYRNGKFVSIWTSD